MKRHLQTFSSILFYIMLVVLNASEALGQTSKQTAVLSGTVYDGSTYTPLSGVKLTLTKDSVSTDETEADVNGHFVVYTKSGGNYNLSFRLAGFQSKTLVGIVTQQSGTVNLTIVLYPLFAASISSEGKSDSLSAGDSLLSIAYEKEIINSINNKYFVGKRYPDQLKNSELGTATDRNTLWAINRLRSVITSEDENYTTNHNINILGLGQRYNQVLWNGAIATGMSATSKAYDFNHIPIEVIDNIQLQTIADARTPADVAGGTIEIKTKDFPLKDFYNIQAGGSFYGSTLNKNFKKDRQDFVESLGFGDSYRNLPAAFPTTRSFTPYNQKNVQEQTDFAKTLNNNLSSIDYVSRPGGRLLFGFGKNLKLNKRYRVGFTGFVVHEKREQKTETTVRVKPDVENNRYPFTQTSKLIQSASDDVNHIFNAATSAFLNAAVSFGRNKVSFKNYFSSSFLENYTTRSNVLKPDEDSLASAGLRISTEQTMLINNQITGEHGFGNNGRLRMDWLASYTFLKKQNPDERNFLLRKAASADLYELSIPQSPELDLQTPSTFEQNFTNSNRLWRTSINHSFTGALNLQLPFNLFKQPQSLAGGLFMQTDNRVFFSDMLLYKGSGVTSLNNLLSPDRYFPGGVSFTNYFNNTDRNSNNGFLYSVNKGNYNASSYIAASYLQLNGRFSKKILMSGGLRLESANLLVTNSQYEFLKGYKNPLLVTIDENASVISFKLLPSAKLQYLPAKNINMYGAYFKTVNRPQFQELLDYRYYDVSSFTIISGNPALYNSSIHNFSAGVNFLPNSTSTIAVSAFYKRIYEPIEYILSNYSTSKGNNFVAPYNTPIAVVKSIQASFELRSSAKKLNSWLTNFSVFGNAIYTESNVEEGPVRNAGIGRVAAHTLSGVPAWTVSNGLTWHNKKFPSLSIIYNYTGDFIKWVGSGKAQTLLNGNTILTIPHYRVKEREQLHIQLSQKFFKERFLLVAGVQNLLQGNMVIYQDLNGNKKFDDAIVTEKRNGANGYYKEGTDNTVSYIKSQSNYFINLSFLF